MSRDHERLEKLYDELLEAFRADVREEVARLWTELDRGLTAHLELEERWVFCAFASVEPEETAELVAEHAQIRRLLAELGVGVDLHAIPERLASAFIQTLRAHARREDALLYRWLDAQLDRRERRAVLDELG